MEFKDGTSVYTADGENAGSLHRVVIDPTTREVTHIVVQKGLLFKEDKVIPIDKVASTSQEKVDLNCSFEELKMMSPLDIAQYQPLSESTESRQNLTPLEGGMYGSSPSARNVIMEFKRSIPDELVALKEGARVISADDQHVGNIEHVFTESETGTVTHFVLTRGLILTTRKNLPIEWIKIITDDEVYLTVEAQKVEDLPVIQE